MIFQARPRADGRARQTSPYKYHSEMAKRGVGADAGYTGMTWSGSLSSASLCLSEMCVCRVVSLVVSCRAVCGDDDFGYGR